MCVCLSVYEKYTWIYVRVGHILVSLNWLLFISTRSYFISYRIAAYCFLETATIQVIHHENSLLSFIVRYHFRIFIPSCPSYNVYAGGYLSFMSVNIDKSTKIWFDQSFERFSLKATTHKKKRIVILGEEKNNIDGIW